MNIVAAVNQVVTFPDEGTLQDVLSRTGIGPQSIHDNLKGLVKSGVKVIVDVPGMPTRALILATVLEAFTGQAASGAELIALPFA